MNRTQYNNAIARSIDAVCLANATAEDNPSHADWTVAHAVTLPHAHSDDVFALIVVAARERADDMMPEVVVHNVVVVAPRTNRDAPITVVARQSHSTLDNTDLRECWSNTAQSLHKRGFTLTATMADVMGAHTYRYHERELEVAKYAAEDDMCEARHENEVACS